MVYIYRIHSPDGKNYIGSTINLKKRWEVHRSMRRSEHKKLINSFKIHGVDNHKFEVIEICNKEVRYERETLIGLEFKVLDTDFGLNTLLPKLKDGSGGFSDDYSVWNKGKKLHYNTWNKGKNLHYKVWNKSIPCSEELKIKISNSKKGKTSHRKGIITGIPAYNSKMLLDLETGVFYNSINDASIAKCIIRQRLSDMLNGKKANITNLVFV